MKSFQRYRNVHGSRLPVDYSIYTEEEANDLGIAYVPWRDAPEQRPLKDKVQTAPVMREWTYVIDDNGFVSPIVDGVVVFDEGRRKQVNFVFGRRYVSGNPFGYGDPRMTSNFHWAEKEARNERTRRAVAYYIQLITRNTVLTTEQWDAIGRIYRSDEERPGATVRSLFKTKAVRAMIREELQSLLDDEGVTATEVIKTYKQIMEESIKAKQFNVAKSVNDKFSDMLDMKPDKVEVSTQQVTAGSLAGFLTDTRGEEDVAEYDEVEDGSD